MKCKEIVFGATNSVNTHRQQQGAGTIQEGRYQQGQSQQQTSQWIEKDSSLTKIYAKMKCKEIHFGATNSVTCI